MAFHAIWNDEPSLEDGLDRQGIAKAIAQVITTCDTPMVIGMYGTWGTGKTSLMKLIQDQLDRGGEVVSVWFDAWQHQFDENPAVALLHKMIDDLGIGEEGRRLLFAIASALGEVALKMTTGVAVNDLHQLQQQYEEERFLLREKQVRLREYFAELLDRASSGGQVRIAFFIDDLDRCLPDNILSVLEALKLFLNMPGCVYVLGADRQALETSIQRRYGGDAELSEVAYLDKIVQLPFVIPRVQPAAARRYIEALLPEQLRETTELLVEGLSQNPRQIKRFVNSLVLNFQLAAVDGAKAQDIGVLVAVLLIQLRNPEVYKELALNAELLENPKAEWMSDPLLASTLKQVERGAARSPELLRRYMNVSESAAVRDVTYDLVLVSPGQLKIQVIKEVRAMTSLGLKEAKDLVESAPVTVVSGVDRQQADEYARQLETVGAEVRIA